MCGIAGFIHSENRPINKNILTSMIRTLNHRGPDDTGFYYGKNAAFAQSRLSIIDISTGNQPMYNEDKSITLIFNGEIFNYIELGEFLKTKGHKFYTKSDTEVIVHAYEEFGLDFVDHLNGQFAIAIWDIKNERLVLARDRVGIRPLFYSITDNNSLVFASEMKAIFEYPEIQKELDLGGLNQIFTLWVNIPPKTVFKNICELAPGNILVFEQKRLHVNKYWGLRFPKISEYEDNGLNYYKTETRQKLYDATTLRLRADVPVASYLSGGLDSSIISTLVKKYHNNDLITFSVAFTDKNYDERQYQEQMVSHLDTRHFMVEATYDKIRDVFPEVVRFAEKPMIRTAPAPLFILSKLVRSNNIKVVLTGEGADEMFGGYNIFKENKIRRFWAKNPDSKFRSSLLSRLYPYIERNSTSSSSFWNAFFKKGLSDTDDKYYSHRIRWNNTSYIKNFLNRDIAAQMNDQEDIYQPLENYLDPDFPKWDPLCQAQYLEIVLFMSGYLLSSQGDRMMMGNSVEGRFPFLDHNVMEFAASMPPGYKLNVLNEKYILKETFSDLVPEQIIKRDKQPYRAPISQVFLNNNHSSVRDSISESEIKSAYVFDNQKTSKLISKLETQKKSSARDDMAIVAIASTQLLHKHFTQ
ncbi:MAG: asparagine synthase (glutamine-hydrolyzing) [Calditrichae bacterium]|nr:asparagine synthase (glutamine-hydrolyzing) [Calditrichia bacterium]